MEETHFWYRISSNTPGEFHSGQLPTGEPLLNITDTQPSWVPKRIITPASVTSVPLRDTFKCVSDSCVSLPHTSHHFQLSATLSPFCEPQIMATPAFVEFHGKQPLASLIALGCQHCWSDYVNNDKQIRYANDIHMIRCKINIPIKIQKHHFKLEIIIYKNQIYL